MLVLVDWPMLFYDTEHKFTAPSALSVLLDVISAPLWESEA